MFIDLLKIFKPLVYTYQYIVIIPSSVNFEFNYGGVSQIKHNRFH